MPRFTIQVPDGRHVTVEANSQDDAMTGVQQWYKANPKPAAPAAPPPQPSMLDRAVGSVGTTLANYGHDFMEANRRSGSELDTALHGFVTPPKSMHMRDLDQSHFLQAGPVVAAALNRIGDPLTAPFTSGFGRPVEALTRGRIKKEDVGNLASIVVPGVGELAGERALTAEALRLSRAKGISIAQAEQEVKFARNPTRVPKLPEVKKPKTPEQATHQERAAKLQREGVDLTTSQREGGLAKTREDRAATGSPYKGVGIQQARQRTLETSNRAAYNRVLAPIGERMGVNSPIGHKGFAEVRGRLTAAYDKALAKATAANDTTFKRNMGTLAKKVMRLPETQRKQFADAFRDEVTHRFSTARGTPAGKMTGKDFKAAETELKRLARTYKGSSIGVEQELGKLFSEAAGYLRDSVDRNSPRNVVKDLRNADTGWAMSKRVEQATAAAGRNDGMFTGGQLVDAVKAPVGLPSKTRREAFARGDALLQDFAQDVHAVTGSKVPDPGTAAQLKSGIVGRTIGGLAGTALGSIFGHSPITGGLGAVAGTTLGGPIDDFIANLTNQRAAGKLTGQMSPTVRQALASPRLSGVVPAAGALSETERAGQKRAHHGKGVKPHRSARDGR